MDEFDLRIQDSLSTIVKGVQEAALIPANLGKAKSMRDPFSVPGKPGYVYVRVKQAGSITGVTSAIWENAARIWNLPVKLELISENKYRVKEIDHTRMHEVAGNAGESDVPGLGVGPHSHEEGSGHFDDVSSIRLKMGRVYIVEDLTFAATPFDYDWQGTRYTYEGADVVTIEAPTTSARRRWALIGVDPATNLLTFTYSAEYNAVSPVNNSEINSIAFNGVWLMAVKLNTGQTGITAMDQLKDKRQFVATNTAISSAILDDIENRLWMF